MTLKMRRLPDIDLARIAPLDRESRVRGLRQLKLGHPPYSYQPARAEIGDILDVNGGLALVARPPWRQIEECVARKSRSDNEFEANIAVAKALHDWALAHDVHGRSHSFFPMRVAQGHSVQFWHNSVIGLNGRAVVPFIDPRRTKRLTAQARRFIFSFMHERIRVLDPDFQDARLAIIQFNSSDDGRRIPSVYLDDDVELFNFDELEQMVRETYDDWIMVLNERDEELRRKAGGMRGSLI